MAAWSAVALSAAHADPLPLHIEREHGPERGDRLLALDPVIVSRLEGLANDTHREATTFSVGNTSLVLESIEAANIDREDRVALDVPFRGWRTGARLSHRLGPLELEGTAMLGYVGSRYTDGHYYDVGVALTYRRKLSRWMTAWISLSVGQRTWTGEPPTGEPKQSSQLMLSVGTTFR